MDNRKWHEGKASKDAIDAIKKTSDQLTFESRETAFAQNREALQYQIRLEYLILLSVKKSLLFLEHPTRTFIRSVGDFLLILLTWEIILSGLPMLVV